MVAALNGPARELSSVRTSKRTYSIGRSCSRSRFRFDREAGEVNRDDARCGTPRNLPGQDPEPAADVEAAAAGLGEPYDWVVDKAVVATPALDLSDRPLVPVEVVPVARAIEVDRHRTLGDA